MTGVGAAPISVIVRRIDKCRDQLIDELFEKMRVEIQGLDYDTRMTDLWRASITENYIAAINYLDRDAPTALLEAPPAALAYARAAAQRDVPLAPLVRAHRLGLAAFLEVAMRHAAALEPAQQTPTIIELVNRSGRLTDMLADQLIAAYEAEHDLWLSRRSGLQQQWIGEVLGGAPVDVSRAERALRYRLDVRHIAAVAWVQPTVPGPEVVTLFDEVRSLITGKLGPAVDSLMVPTDEYEARLWFAPGGPLDAGQVRSAIESAKLPVHLAFGRVEHGLHGFRASMEQAQRAKAVAVAGCDRFGDRVVSYGDLVPITLMANHIGELRRYVSDVLNGLAADDERGEWLRETLRQFLSLNRSYVATAQAMTLHRNTIQYRVGQAMELSGQSFDDPEAVFRVQIALEVCRWMAPGVLRMAR
ncbi:PucR family transcriptional regulator [Mycobacterium asiaticum]|uniref:PucR family transcriptional regulator n=1 Tax=Mycobacterium asiaticum TaxID=1790 RepID=UPI000569E6D1|nr:helix-turn-helix domain-containing protein [Mycobacterium asiaticum]ORA18273.1 hypothetical protein BST16_02605 [Mycobacterium asiaticum DSM 44297]